MNDTIYGLKERVILMSQNNMLLFLRKKVIFVLDKIQENEFVVGTKQTKKAIESGRASMVFLAQDASEYLKNEIITACKARKLEMISVNSMQELGSSCGICRGAATAAIIK